MNALRWGAELPDIQPGALPRLQSLNLWVQHQISAAPPSWGAPSALPSLQFMSLEMIFAAPLPAQWAAGFRSLHTLHLLHARRHHPSHSTRPQMLPDEAEAVAHLPPMRLPPEWGDGFPLLLSLHLSTGSERTSTPAPRIQDMLPPRGLSTVQDL